MRFFPKPICGAETLNSELRKSTGLLSINQHDVLVLYVVRLHEVREKLLYNLGQVFLVQVIPTLANVFQRLSVDYVREPSEVRSMTHQTQILSAC